MRIACLALALAACGSDAKGTADAPAGTDAPAVDAPAPCIRTQGADGTHFVVVSRPYDKNGDGADTFEVLSLSSTGTLTRPGVTFSLGRASEGAIAFTPDGKIGMVPEADGTVGVFSLAGDGTPAVVAASFGDPAFYASRVVIDPSGAFAYVVDSDTTANGGGIYALAIACDGTPSLVGKVATASAPNGLVLDGDRAFLLTAQSGLDAPAGDEAVMLHWPGGAAAPTVAASSDAFGDDLASIGGSALTHDRGTLLVGDVNGFSGIPNRVGVVHVTADALAPATVITPIVDPEAIVASPYGNVAIVTSTADGDAIYVLDDQGAGGAWRNRGKVAYVGAGPQIPADMAAIARGNLTGRVLVSEVSSIRQLQFGSDGSVTDEGSLAFGGGDDLDQILGAIGVTP